MQATRTRDKGLVLSELGSLTRTATLRGAWLGEVTLTETPDWDEDTEAYRYTIESDEACNESDELEEALYMLADQIRTIRNAAIGDENDRLNDEARDQVETLIELGSAAKVLKALKAAGLI